VLLLPDRTLRLGAGSDNDIVIEGERISEYHACIKYENDSLRIENLNLLAEESCGLYSRLLPDESKNLKPGCAFRIGSLEFVVERFNTGVVSDIG